MGPVHAIPRHESPSCAHPSNFRCTLFMSSLRSLLFEFVALSVFPPALELCHVCYSPMLLAVIHVSMYFVCYLLSVILHPLQEVQVQAWSVRLRSEI